MKRLLVFAVLALGLVCGRAAVAQTFPDRPGADSYIVDEAQVLDAETAQEVENTCRALRVQTEIPVIVVTIRSMAAHGAGGWEIERYASALFDHWGIGSPRYNRGMLLLISIDDRKARIEMGADWAHTKDGLAQEVMQRLIVPECRGGHYSKAVQAGVEGLDAIARDRPLPGRPLLKRMGDLLGEAWRWLVKHIIWLIVPPVVVGNSWWNYRRYGTIFSPERDSGWGFGGGGGSFGGGFSGGGGATGSW